MVYTLIFRFPEAIFFKILYDKYAETEVDTAVADSMQIFLDKEGLSPNGKTSWIVTWHS